MKVFISWSGPISKQIGKAFKDWLPDVIQGTEIFMSSQDIAKGERGAKSMWDALDGYEFGLSIVTPQNKNAPWIMFEAGAMMRFSTARVAPILCNLDQLDVASTPLDSFQCSKLEKTEILAVIQSMNQAAGSPLPDDKLLRTFNMWWPQLEEKLSVIDMSDGIAKKDEPFDQAAHFKRLENGITAIIGAIDRIHMDAATERGARNFLLKNSKDFSWPVAKGGYLSSLSKLYENDIEDAIKLSALKKAMSTFDEEEGQSDYSKKPDDN